MGRKTHPKDHSYRASTRVKKQDRKVGSKVAERMADEQERLMLREVNEGYELQVGTFKHTPMKDALAGLLAQMQG